MIASKASVYWLSSWNQVKLVGLKTMQPFEWMQTLFRRNSIVETKKKKKQKMYFISFNIFLFVIRKNFKYNNNKKTQLINNHVHLHTSISLLIFLSRQFLKEAAFSQVSRYYIVLFNRHFCKVFRAVVNCKLPIGERSLPVGVTLRYWVYIFPNPSAWAGYDTRPIFKRNFNRVKFWVFLLLD